MRTIVNEGVIVRHGTARNNQEYLVLWSLASNHSFIFKNDIATDEWFEAGRCEWREYDIDVNSTRGPEGIETQAYNLRKPEDDAQNPCTTPCQAYTDVHSLRTVNVFVPHENTIKFKDTFVVTDNSDRISGNFIKNARISPSDVRELRKCNITSFEGIAVLDVVAKRGDASPWKITQFVYEAKELSLQGYCCKLGFLRHGRGGALCNRNEAYVPPDPLRLKNVSVPSRFSLSVAEPSAPVKKAPVQVKKIPELTQPLQPPTSDKTSSLLQDKNIQPAAASYTTTSQKPLTSQANRNPNVPVFPAKIRPLVPDDDDPGFPAIVNGKTNNNSAYFVHIFHKDIAAMVLNTSIMHDIQVGDIVAVKIRFNYNSRPGQNSRHEVIHIKKIEPSVSVIKTLCDNSGFAVIKLIALYQGTEGKFGRIFYNDFLGQIFDNFNRVPSDAKLDRKFYLEASVKLIKGGQAGLVCTRFLGYGDQAAVEASKRYLELRNISTIAPLKQNDCGSRDASHLLENFDWALGILKETEVIDAENLWDDYLVVVSRLYR